MSDADTWVERAEFLAAVQSVSEGDEIAAACFRLMVEMETKIPAPWAETDPFAAEFYLVARGASPVAAEFYLVARGASPVAAAANAVEFEVNMRAVVGLANGRPVTDFQEIADWIAANVDGDDQ
jgi:hypothetical protein